MSEGPLWTVAGIGDRIRGFARGNLAALLSGQAVLTLVNIAILIMINRVYARPGDATDAGRLAAVLSLMLAAVVLTVSGISASLTRRISLARAGGGEDRIPTIARAIGGGLTLAAVVGFALMLLGLAAPQIAYAAAKAWWPEQAPNIEPYVWALQLAALWLPSLSLGLVFSAVFDGFQRMRWSLLAEAGTFQVMRLAGAIVAMLLAGWAWTGLIGAWGVAYAIATVLMGLELWVMLRLERQPVAWRRLPLGGLVRDGVFMFLPTVAPVLFSQAGVLVAWLAVGDKGAATFWVTWGLVVAVTAICWPVGRALFPAIPGLLRTADRREVTRIFRRAFWGASGVALLFILAVGTVKTWLLACLHQEGQGMILTVLLAAAFFETVRVVFNPVLLGSGAERALALLEWISLGVVLVCGSVGAVAWGVPGLVGVFVAVCAFSTAARIRLLAQATGVRLWREVAVMTAVVTGVTVVLGMMEWQGWG
jgi:O-antigen/teichoic acid export membrane protein